MVLAVIKRRISRGSTFRFRSLLPIVFQFHRDTTTVTMADSTRTYAEALSLLDTLQSNRAVMEMIQNSSTDINQSAIPEMLDWVRKAGYTVEDFNKLKAIHVAGTKGKGSVCAMVSSILQQYSQTPPVSHTTSIGTARTDGELQKPASKAERLGKIGLYTSPHLITVRERIRVNNAPISQSLFASHFFELWDRFSASAAAAGHPNPACSETKPGYFRYLTIMALHVFLQEGVETAIVECGIGGEYDSTNILAQEAVTVTAITRLGIDHVGMLGDTIEKIAWHKGGIMKKGVECFTVPQVEEAMGLLQERAKKKGAVLNVVSRREDIESGDVKVRLEGEFQKENASLAVAVAGAHLNRMGFENVLRNGKLPAEFLRGLEEVKWEGRCEVIEEGNIEWCIDGAHTMESLEITAKWFAGKLAGHTKGQAMLIFNQQYRDAAILVRALHFSLERATGARHIFSNAAFCANLPYKLPDQHSGLSIGTNHLEVQRTVANAWGDFESDTEVEIYASIEEAVDNAREIAKDRERLQVLVTGSLHLVGGFLKVLRKNEAVS